MENIGPRNQLYKTDVRSLLLMPWKRICFLSIRIASLEIRALHLTTLNLQTASTKPAACSACLRKNRPGMCFNPRTERQTQAIEGYMYVWHDCSCYCLTFNNAIIPKQSNPLNWGSASICIILRRQNQISSQKGAAVEHFQQGRCGKEIGGARWRRKDFSPTEVSWDPCWSSTR